MASDSHPVSLIALISNSTSDGHYLNLPVMNEGGEIVGMVDVLKLTYATLEQVSVADSTY
jgi:hypothetical protein